VEFITISRLCLGFAFRVGITLNGCDGEHDCGKSDVMRYRQAMGFGAVFVSLLMPALAQNGVVNEAGAQRAIDLQLQSIVRGVQGDIGRAHADGSVIERAELRGRTIWQRVRMSYDKYSAQAAHDFYERRKFMQRQLCQGETAKLIPYGVAWEYEFVDQAGARITSFRIDECGR
jgi:hypothetical protein